MKRAEPRSETPPVFGWWRGVLYTAATGFRVLVALAGVALLCVPIAFALKGSERGTGVAGGLIVASLALLGVGIPVISAVLARSDWNGSSALLGRSASGGPAIRLREPRTLVRPLAYAVVMLTLGGAIAVLAALLVVASVVALVSPFLTATGDHAVIGPFDVHTVPESVIAVVVAVLILAGLLVASPALARLHAALVQQMLTRPEQRLQRDLAMTAQSRARLVRAFDVERRRIERDLHDGVQPQLLSVSMTLGLALAAMPEDAPGREDVARAQEQARRTLDALRQFVRNIHPQVLIDHGLGAAIAELVDTIPIPIKIADELTDRLPADVETNLYFCVAELLANVVKHSGADHAEVRLGTPNAALVRITVQDDGHGGAGMNRHDGGGLDGIADRIAAFDGTLMIDSPLGGPTAATITLSALAGGRAND